ncbi:SDR family NAD(P)-dependent oxidoreductase [Chrysosporum bergii ANA360D]|uniref:SDR family NAD(P)-dependent oxidoreductase n=1 Tax=Chrysosporum bergii ANA360D TaxID=617107 RepID=A0AA43GTX5_9CYAN|nr:SDR family NAD(P)-dependent oxidoreductase [Chrysosporum bergii]MDH6061598.1 SDR family NAD(P)-dependent oxidoreductase [Chrysosporum bergii ANA360D]
MTEFPLNHSIRRGWAKLQYLPTPDQLDFTVSNHHVCLITADGSPLTTHLAQSLTARGWTVVVLSFPESVISHGLSLPTGINHVMLSDMSEAHLQQQLKAMAENYGPVGAFIHLSPLETTATTAKAIVKQVFLLAKHLKKPLTEVTQPGRSSFITVSRLDGNLGMTGHPDVNPIDGGLLGLTKTLNLEWEKVFCRGLDISPHVSGERAAQSIMAELYDPNQLIVEVGYSAQGRTTLINEEYAINRTSINQPNHLHEDAVFLVSGGGRGITSQCVIKLARVFKCKFILLGRSAMDGEPDYAGGCSDENELKKRIIEHISAQGEKPTPVKVNKMLKSILHSREIQATISQIEQVGGRAEYISADITAGTVVQEKVAAVAAKFGKITGIIHGAGNLADKLIQHKTPDDFEAVYVPKIMGLQTLLGCVEPSQLHHLVLFSSAAGFYGNIGQSDYAIANEILNKFAHQLKHQHPQCHIVSFNWGAWDGGMVTPEVKEVLAQRNIDIIPLEVGTQMFVEELAFAGGEQVQVLVGGSLATRSGSLEPELRTHRIRRKLTLEDNPFLQDHMIGDHAVLPATCSAAWMANTCEQLYPAYKFFTSSNFKVLKGIVFDQTLADEYIVDVQEVSKSAENEVKLNVTVWSHNSKGKPQYHYSSQIQLLRQIPPSPTYPEFDATTDEYCLTLSPYQDGALFHGPTFQGVKRVLNMSPKKLTLECQMPAPRVQKYGLFPVQTFDPYTADTAYQAMLIWIRHFHQAPGLPLKCEKYEYFQQLPSGTMYYVSMEVVSISNTHLKANAILHDIHGQVYLQLLGAEGTLSKQLNPLFIPAQEREKNKLSSFWRKLLGYEHPVLYALFTALYQRFVGAVVLEDSQDFDEIKATPKLYLANHQVGIESLLFMFGVAALTDNPIHAVAKAEHRYSWISQMRHQLYSYPNSQDPELGLYFDRENPSSMMTVLAAIKKLITEQGRSVLVHVQGTCSLSCRQPVTSLSAVFIDLALELNLPIVPVKFVGGLPIEPLETRLEFPVGYTHQDYYLGKAIYPETLKSLDNAKRKALILELLNQVGGALETSFPHTPDLDFAHKVETWMQQAGVSEAVAVLYKVLEEISNPTDEIRTLLTGIREGNFQAATSPEQLWLKEFANWLTSN